MQHFRAEIGELHRLLVRHRLQQARVGHLTRIAGVDAIYVGPDFTAVGTQTGGQHRGGVVRAVTPQHHQFALLIASGKAGHQDHISRRDLAGGDAARRFGDIDGRFEIVADGQQLLHWIDHGDAVAARQQQRLHNGD